MSDPIRRLFRDPVARLSDFQRIDAAESGKSGNGVEQWSSVMKH